MPDSPVTADAVLQDEQGRSILRFERALRHPPERVWEALTERSELGAWHPSPFEFERFVGGVVTYHEVADGPSMPPGEVREYEPPRLLSYTWDQDLLRWELQPQDDGTLLVLTHTFDDRFKAARDAAGWHLCLIALEAALDGRKARGTSDDERIPQGWPELNSAYEQRFGIPHEQATPPPEM
jgi:uncharacterized protein YndB with AHSA1/START domain